MRPETIKFLEENIKKKLTDVGLGNDFFRYDTQSTSNNINDKRDYIKLKIFCTAKETE